MIVDGMSGQSSGIPCFESPFTPAMANGVGVSFSEYWALSSIIFIFAAASRCVRATGFSIDEEAPGILVALNVNQASTFSARPREQNLLLSPAPVAAPVVHGSSTSCTDRRWVRVELLRSSGRRS